ncbi:Nucleotidyltransferase (fragment) [Pseudomonas sp. 8Z]|uniref:nucleotidyltransferase substrate binding protein n=1 Tax=Pseudomonas sp. 8Z TaxID=2653166 RepID=UPI0012F2C3F1
MAEQDIRWLQRLSNYERALAQLTRAVELARTRPLTELERQGLIQAFEFVFELAWNLMKDYFLYQGSYR